MSGVTGMSAFLSSLLQPQRTQRFGGAVGWRAALYSIPTIKGAGVQLGAWGWGAEALPDSPQLPRGNCSPLQGPSQPLPKPLSNPFASKGHSGLLGHFNLTPFELVTVTTSPGTQRKGLWQIGCPCDCQTMATLAGGT